MRTGNPAEGEFPSPVYAETVLTENFRDAQRFFLDALIDIHYAHTVMLAKQEIVSKTSANACLCALDALDRERLRSMAYDGRFEDLFFAVQHEVEQLAGVEHGGQMHTARSRNDIDLTLYRMCLRREVLAITEEMHGLCAALLDIARQNVHTLIPAYTHTQPAQPSTLAHYIIAAVECFERDQGRLQAAFATVNRNPLGACAITTTGFPIDRNYTAEMLGFEGLQLNSYGAVAATDYATEAAGAIATAMVNLGRLVQDLLLWCNPALGFLHLSPAWIQCSSIMPQKRNPVALEHVRILASKSLAQAQGVFTATHNTPFGDIVDCEDDLQPLVFSLTADTRRALRLFAGVMKDCKFDTGRLRVHAGADFLTVTELADEIAREEGLSFRTAHRLVSNAVDQLKGSYSAEGMIRAVEALAPEHIGKRLTMSGEKLAEALDPGHFVAVRRVPGGPAAGAVEAALQLADNAQEKSTVWMSSKRAFLERVAEKIAAERELL